MSKKNIVTTDSVELVAFDGTEVILHGQFLLGRCSDGSPKISGDIELSSNNRDAIQTLNHGAKPDIEFDDKGQERQPIVPCDPLRDHPLWSYAKPSKKLGTTGKVVPIQSVHNRPTDPGQVGDIRGSLLRDGYDTKRRTLSICTLPSGESYFVDGGHTSTAISQLNDDSHDWDDISKNKEGEFNTPLNCSNVVSVQILQGDGSISGFDEGQRTRQVKDMLSALALSPGWESDVQVALSSICLLCSGKTVDGSGKSLPHMLTPEGKIRKLTASEVANLFVSDIPGFNRIREALDCINSKTINTLVDTDNVIYADTPLCDYPTFARYSLPGWILAIIEVSYAGYAIADIVDAIHGIIEDDSNSITAKLNSWASVKGKGKLSYQYPILCSLLFALIDPKIAIPSRKPTARASCLIKVAYDSWVDSQA